MAKPATQTVVRRPTHQEIAARAYQIWLERGMTHGHDVDDWLQAEYELMQTPVRVLAQMPVDPQSGEKSLLTLVQNALAEKPRRTRSKKSGRVTASPQP